MNGGLLATIAVAILGGGTAAAVIAAIANRRKTRAEASNVQASGSEAVARGAQLIVETSESLLAIRDREVKRLEERFEMRLHEVRRELERKLDDRNGEIAELRRELASARVELAQERAQNEQLLAHNQELSDRVMALEQEIERLREAAGGGTV